MNKELKKSANKKAISDIHKGVLISTGSPFEIKYLKSLGCLFNQTIKEGKLTTIRCRARWCEYCEHKKLIDRIIDWAKPLQQHGELEHTVLTLPNVYTLEEIIQSQKQYVQFLREFRRRYKYETGKDFIGTMHFECHPTFTLINGILHFTGYHPHVHILHPTMESWESGKTKLNKKTKKHEQIMHNLIIWDWLGENPQCDAAAQRVQKCTGVIEGFKYLSKSVQQTKVNGKTINYIPKYEQDTIYRSLYRQKTFWTYGLKKANLTEEETNALLNELEIKSKEPINKPDGNYKFIRALVDWELQQDKEDPNYKQILLADNKPSKKYTSYLEEIETNSTYENHLNTYKTAI